MKLGWWQMFAAAAPDVFDAVVQGLQPTGRRLRNKQGLPNPQNKSSRRRQLKIQVHCVALGFSANVQLFRLMRKFLQDCRKKRIVAGLEAEKEKDSDGESIYESRKLLIRQMQGQIAKQVRFIFTTDQKYN